VFQDVFREACARATVEIAAAENRLVDEFATKYGRTVVRSTARRSNRHSRNFWSGRTCLGQAALRQAAGDQMTPR